MDFGKTRTSTLFTRYVIPQMIGLVFNSIYFIVDGVFIGRRLGTGALAAAGVAVPVVEGMIALSMLIAVGTGSMVSAAVGRGEKAAGRGIFNYAVRGTLVVSALVAVPGIVFVRPLASFLGADAALMTDTTVYLRTFLAFSPFLIFSFVLSTCVRNDGNPRLAMWALTIGSLSNILLDYVFMYPLNMGMAGAALATGLGPVFSVLLMMPHFLKKRGILFFEKGGALRRGGVRLGGSILVNGLPAFVAEFSIGFVTLLYNRAIVQNGLGEAGLAAYVVIGYAALICLTAFLGAAQGVQPAVSYFTGAGEPARIQKLFRATVVFCLGLAVGLYLLLFFAGGAFFGIFIRGDATLLAYAAGKARLYFLGLPSAAMNILLVSFLQAMGKITPAMVVSLARSTLPVFGFLWLLPLVLPTNGLWLAAAAAEALTLLVGVLLWVRVWRTANGGAAVAPQKVSRASLGRQEG